MRLLPPIQGRAIAAGGLALAFASATTTPTGVLSVSLHLQKLKVTMEPKSLAQKLAENRNKFDNFFAGAGTSGGAGTSFLAPDISAAGTSTSVELEEQEPEAQLPSEACLHVMPGTAGEQEPEARLPREGCLHDHITPSVDPVESHNKRIAPLACGGKLADEADAQRVDFRPPLAPTPCGLPKPALAKGDEPEPVDSTAEFLSNINLAAEAKLLQPPPADNAPPLKDLAAEAELLDLAWATVPFELEPLSSESDADLVLKEHGVADLPRGTGEWFDKIYSKKRGDVYSEKQAGKFIHNGGARHGLGAEDEAAAARFLVEYYKQLAVQDSYYMKMEPKQTVQVRALTEMNPSTDFGRKLVGTSNLNVHAGERIDPLERQRRDFYLFRPPFWKDVSLSNVLNHFRYLRNRREKKKYRSFGFEYLYLKVVKNFSTSVNVLI